MSLFATAERIQRNGDRLPTMDAVSKPLSELYDLATNKKSSSGVRVNADNAISLSTVFNALTLLSETVAQLPLSPYIIEEVEGIMKRRKFKDDQRYNLVAHEPNEYMSSETYRKTVMNHLVRYDRAYSIIDRGPFGEPLQYFPWHPLKVRKIKDEDGGFVYEFRDNGETFYINEANVLHNIGYTDNGLEGKSRIDLLFNSLGNALAVEQFAGQYFGKGINVSGFIKTPNKLKDESAVERLKTSFIKKYGGRNNAFGVGVLEEGSDYQQMEADPEKAQLLQSRKVNGLIVAQAWNIPLPMLKDLDKATYNNVEQLDIQFSKYTINPWVKNFEAEYRRKLLTEEEKREGNIYFKHNMNGLMRGDMQSRGKFYESLGKVGALAPNNALDFEEMEGYPGGGVHLVPSGYTTVEKINNETSEEE